MRVRNVMGWVAAIALSMQAAETMVLWPSESSVARALPDSRVALAEGGVVRVEAGANYDWPGDMAPRRKSR